MSDDDWEAWFDEFDELHLDDDVVAPARPDDLRPIWYAVAIQLAIVAFVVLGS